MSKEPHFHVIFRACDLVLAVNKSPRPWDLDKRTLIEVCFKSLHDALLPVSHQITVLGDKISPELTAFFERHQVKLVHGDFGNQESIRQTYALAESVPDEDWIYFCEDDYLHVQHAFTTIRDLIVHRQSAMPYKPRLHSLAALLNPGKADLVIFPPDYPDRYSGKYRRFSLLFLAGLSHWRQVTDTTFTFLIQARTFRKYKRVLFKAAVGANDRYLSRKLYGRHHFFGKALCVSPIPALSTHMHTNVMSPLVDWDAALQRCSSGQDSPNRAD